jgi:hypothetical protein
MRFNVIILLAAVLASATGSLAGLPKCHEEATADPDGWQQIVAPHEDIAFALPPEFAWSENQPASIHGGGRWAGSGIEVTISYGHWALASFDPEDADQTCQTEVNGLSVVLIAQSGVDLNSITAWIQTKAQVYEPVLGISFTDWDDVAVARHIIGSVRRIKEK